MRATSSTNLSASTVAAVPSREKGMKNDSSGSRPGRAFEDHAQERRPRAASRRVRRVEASLRARRRRPRPVRPAADRDVQRVRARRLRGTQHEDSAAPTPRRPANSHRYDSASVRTRTENRFPAATSMWSRESATKRRRRRTRTRAHRAVAARSTARSRISYVPGATVRRSPGRTRRAARALRNLLWTR
jgi:hypothetical protein